MKLIYLVVDDEDLDVSNVKKSSKKIENLIEIS